MNAFKMCLVAIAIVVSLGAAAKALDFSGPAKALSDAASDYHSFTKAIINCDNYGNCIGQDYYVQCEGRYIMNMTPVSDGVVIQNYNGVLRIKDWCE
jgi:hypothetical protein